MKRGLKITVWILGLLAVLLLAALVAIQSPAVQTYLGKQIMARLEKSTDATIRFKNISVRPTEAILLEDLVVLDNQPLVPGMDTILYVNSLSVKFSLRGLLQGRGAYVSRLRLHGGGFNLAIEPNPPKTGWARGHQPGAGLPRPAGRRARIRLRLGQYPYGPPGRTQRHHLPDGKHSPGPKGSGDGPCGRGRGD